MPKIASSELRWLAAPLPSGCGQFSLLLRHTGTVVVARKALACGVTSASSVSFSKQMQQIYLEGGQVPHSKEGGTSPEVPNQRPQQ
jgi:hypothetical protein